jgi:hypothetical protein
MAKQDWTPLTIMSSHLQKLVKHGFVVVVELKSCRMPEDPVFPTRAK